MLADVLYTLHPFQQKIERLFKSEHFSKPLFHTGLSSEAVSCVATGSLPQFLCEQHGFPKKPQSPTLYIP